MKNTDQYFMDIALNLARRGLGLVAPNPAVGCVLVKNNQIIARGWTAPGGRPHAETEALKRAGKNARGATAYVTLEPCCHYGKTPPCSQALIKAGIKCAVIATTDPDTRMSGKGIQELKDAGIEVKTGIGKKEADEINAGFFLTIKEIRPLVTLKLALSADGKIARKNERTQITGKIATAYSHLLRKSHDAIMVGSNTLKIDQPQLTCRLPGLENTSPSIVKPSHNLKKKLNELSENGITRLLVEGGAELAQSFLDTNLVDQLILIQNPNLKLGSNSVPAPKINLSNFRKTESRNLGFDILTTYKKT